MKKFVLVLVLMFSFLSTKGQDRGIFRRGKNDTIPVAVTVYDGAYIPWVAFDNVTIAEKRTFANVDARNQYARLKRNVLKVLPYARLARLKYQKLERDLAMTNDKKKQKALVAACEKEIKDMFYKEIKNMSISQGEILIKLIDREVGHSSYELVKELKGTLTAFFLQSVARVFGHNLKTKYNPEEERDIESILASVGYNSLQ